VLIGELNVTCVNKFSHIKQSLINIIRKIMDWSLCIHVLFVIKLLKSIQHLDHTVTGT
jgi:hypothetical protein